MRRAVRKLCRPKQRQEQDRLDDFSRAWPGMPKSAVCGSLWSGAFGLLPNPDSIDRDSRVSRLRAGIPTAGIMFFPPVSARRQVEIESDGPGLIPNRHVGGNPDAQHATRGQLNRQAGKWQTWNSVTTTGSQRTSSMPVQATVWTGPHGPAATGILEVWEASSSRPLTVQGVYQMGEVQARSCTVGTCALLQQPSRPAVTVSGSSHETPESTQISWLQRQVGFSSTRA